MNTSPFGFTFSYFRIVLKWIIGAIGIYCLFLFVFHENSWEKQKVLWLLDTSLSMVAQDIQKSDTFVESRFSIARQIILSGAINLPIESALVTFGDGIRLQLPFSQDNDTFASVLSAIEPQLYWWWTDIITALKGLKLLYPYQSFHIVLLSDGEITGSGTSTLPVLNANTPITILWIGTESWAKMLQWYDAAWKPRYKQYNWADAVTRLGSSYLKILADTYQGDIKIISQYSEVPWVIQDMRESLPKSATRSDNWELYLGCICLILAIILHPYTIKKQH